MNRITLFTLTKNKEGLSLYSIRPFSKQFLTTKKNGFEISFLRASNYWLMLPLASLAPDPTKTRLMMVKPELAPCISIA